MHRASFNMFSSDDVWMLDVGQNVAFREGVAQQVASHNFLLGLRNLLKEGAVRCDVNIDFDSAHEHWRCIRDAAGNTIVVQKFFGNYPTINI